MQKKIFQELTKLKPFLEEKYAVTHLGVFGSFARNEETENSDIDVLVQFSKPIGLEFCALKLFLEEKMKRQVDLVTPKALKHQIKDDILNETIYL